MSATKRTAEELRAHLNETSWRLKLGPCKTLGAIRRGTDLLEVKEPVKLPKPSPLDYASRSTRMSTEELRSLQINLLNNLNQIIAKLEQQVAGGPIGIPTASEAKMLRDLRNTIKSIKDEVYPQPPKKRSK